MLASVGLGAAILALAFGIVWLLCVRIDNYGFLDVIWSLSIAIVAPLYALLAHGNALRAWVFASIGTLWSLRLGLYILIRVSRHLPKEDARYRSLREKWPTPGRFLLFFELQALIALMFSSPFLLASLNRKPEFDKLEFFGLLLALGATAGESIADWQAQSFRNEPANKDKVNDKGLWRYSRHPNYFFESLVWWGFFIAALGSPYGWLTILCPLLMLYLLFNVTGIPLTEKHSLESRGQQYRDYQERTSAFVPWFRKAH